MDRGKVIWDIERCTCHVPDACRDCSHDRGKEFPDCIIELLSDAMELLKRSFTPEEVYQTVIEHGQHDKRFRLGDAINYTFPEVIDILRIELMCKAGDM